MINVNKPFLPPYAEYDAYIQGVWKRNWLTNNGPLVNQLELKLKEYLQLPHLLFLNNGTIALQIAIKAFELKGEIITTPFSYVATTSSIVWEGCSPIFADIEEETLNIDPKEIERVITKRTTAILATHVYGNPCSVDSIEEIAKKYNLKVIYDAAHCFGTKYLGRSVFSYGDISTTSFHATKLFHTIEGGAVFTSSPDLLMKMAYMRNFGHHGSDDFSGVGINGKNSEFHAAMGLANLNYVTNILETRKQISHLYNRLLLDTPIKGIKLNKNAEFNYAYYPIILPSEEVLLKVYNSLLAHEIGSRRYFYPVLSKLNYLRKQETPIAADISARVLCLPLYYDLTTEEVNFICRIILRAMNN
jgi:dTDP-4-amino-4,6-dideoxygalactose transaminase